MSIKSEIYFDTRSIRKKTNDYPYKLRVYAGTTKLYPTVFGLSREDNDKLKAKNLGPKLQQVRDKLQKIERAAAEFIKEVDPFSFEDFERDFIKDNPFFVQIRIKARPLLEAQKGFDFTPYLKKFPILLENPPAGTIGEVYLALIKEKLSRKKVKTATLYRSAYTSLKRFGGNARFQVVTGKYLYLYSEWMKYNTDDNKKKSSKTTIGMYTKTLRTVFNEAIALKIIKKDKCYPFGKRQFVIPGSNNIKKAFSIDELHQIYYFECDPQIPQLRKARAFWFFLYYGQGMNPKDMVGLQYKNIVGEFIEFERAKTEETLQDDPPKIRAFLNQDMLKTIEEYGNQDKNPENYIFPVFEPDMTPLRQMEVLEDYIKFINKWMQRILDKLGIKKNAGCQQARHSYATIRRLAGASLFDIQEELGQKNPLTTKRYVASLPCEQKKEIAKQLEVFKRKKKDDEAA